MIREDDLEDELGELLTLVRQLDAEDRDSILWVARHLSGGPKYQTSAEDVD